MGAFFSLRGAAEWDDAVSKMAIPSIWSNVDYSPLSRERKVLLDRSGRAQYSFPSGLRQEGELLLLSDVSDAALVVAVDESAGHFYCGLLLSCPHPHLQHKLRRRVDEITLKPGGSVELRSTDKPKPTRGAGLTPLAVDSVMCDDGEGMGEEEYPHLLLYGTKEGVLCFFSHDVEECEAVVQLVASSYSRGASGKSKRGKAADAAAVGESPTLSQVKVLNHHVGRCAPPVSRVLGNAIVRDLQRRFAISCEPEEGDGCTNCVALCMRLLTATQLSVRGYDVERACDVRQELGPKAGKAAAEAWERLLRLLG